MFLSQVFFIIWWKGWAERQEKACWLIEKETQLIAASLNVKYIKNLQAGQQTEF